MKMYLSFLTDTLMGFVCERGYELVFYSLGVDGPGPWFVKYEGERELWEVLPD